MNTSVKKYGLMILKILVALPFIAAGIAKISGVEMMVTTFDTIGLGQWFRYLTGVIEVSAAILLFIPNKQFYGALLLVCTMLGAILAHWIWLGPSAVPAITLGSLAGIIAYAHRKQVLSN